MVENLEASGFDIHRVDVLEFYPLRFGRNRGIHDLINPQPDLRRGVFRNENSEPAHEDTKHFPAELAPVFHDRLVLETRVAVMQICENGECSA